jgi:hypothetical protein
VAALSKTSSENTCVFVVGRLMEIRLAAGFRTPEDVDQMNALLHAQAALFGHKPFVIVADWRGVNVMSQDTAAKARAMLTQANPHVIRSALLVQEVAPTTTLQVHRLVKEAQNDNRRMFTKVTEQAAWLAEVLTPQELSRLYEFLAMG